MPFAEVETAIEPAKQRERGRGRGQARREQRVGAGQKRARPAYIVRNIPTYDVMSGENLISHRGATADRNPPP